VIDRFQKEVNLATSKNSSSPLLQNRTKDERIEVHEQKEDALHQRHHLTKDHSTYRIDDKHDLQSEATWSVLYPTLRYLAKQFVYSFHVSCWNGQEEDIVEDIVQEVARRILEYSLRAQRGEVKPIYSLEHAIRTIVHNYCIDLTRRDRRLIHSQSHEFSFEDVSALEYQMNLFEEATENIYREEVFTLIAQDIANFPQKQRKALLIDLANRMIFDNQPTPLQKAFLAVGIHLQEYQQPLPENHTERSRHSALLNIAYNRIAHLSCLQELLSKNTYHNGNLDDSYIDGSIESDLS
jgi:DNA-directed RNA polymerase specialized sigma24 family protein